MVKVINSWMMSWMIHVQGMREERNAHKISAGNSEEMRPFVGRRDRGEDVIKVNFKLIGHESVKNIKPA
jgi:hypothetical protein